MTLNRRDLLLASLLSPLTFKAFSSEQPSLPSAPPIASDFTSLVDCVYPTLELRGKAFDRGAQYGSIVSAQIKNNLKFYAEIFAEKGVDWEKAKQVSEKFLPFIEKYSPESLEEIRGIAQGAGVLFEDILTLNCRSEILFAMTDACSCVAFLAEDGFDEHVFMGQTWDWYKAARSNTCILKVHQDGKPSILMVTEAGIIGGKGVNSSGIGVCLNAVSVGKGKLGVPLHLMMRNVLNSTTINDALNCVAHVPRAGSGIFNIASSSNFAMSVEFSPEQFDVLMSEGDPVIHTNHFLSPLIAPYDTGKAGPLSTYTRLNLLRRSLKKLNLPLDANEIFKYLLSHVDYPYSTCVHAIEETGPLSICSVYAMVIDCTAQKLWITNGDPCAGRVSCFSLATA